MALDFQRTRDLLYDFKFQDLFIEELGWSQPSSQKAVPLSVEDRHYKYKSIAEVSGVAVFEVTAEDGKIPEVKIRAAIHKEIADRIAENLLIFVDEERTRSLWYWVKREGSKRYFRDHLYVRGQPGDLFLSKLGSLVIDITELEHSEPSVVEIAHKLQSGFDVERVTKKFYKEFQEQHLQFLQFVQGIDKKGDRRWYTSVILNRLMFVYFLQRKGFIDNGNLDYLQHKLEQSKQRGENRFYLEFLQALFFEVFAKPEFERDDSLAALVGEVKYLDGGLFLKHPVEQAYRNIAIADEAFEQILDLFSRYSWNLDDTPGGKDDEINPDVLGYIFEKYINQKAFGAYYTRPEITEYLCDHTINKLIVDRVNAAISPLSYPPPVPLKKGEAEGVSTVAFQDINELLIQLDSNLCNLLINEILPSLSILDPACGSGAFLVAAMKTLISVYSAVIGTIKLKGDRRLKQWLSEIESGHPSLSYFVKKRIITDNLYGVDIMEEATEIAKLRLFLALVSSAQEVDELEPLPNIDFNIMSGNSLIGLIRVDEESFDTVGDSKHKQGNLLQSLAASNYRQILEDKNQSIELYKKHAFELEDGSGTPQENRLQMLRNHIDKVNRESSTKLNQLLLDEFSTKLGIKYEQAQLKGRGKKRILKIADIEALKPFHWGYHFDKVIEEKGGFDVIITNPPWEIFKPNAKEFFADHSEKISKKKMSLKEFKAEMKRLLVNEEIKNAWLEYQSNYIHQKEYFRLAPQYQYQVPIINGKRHVQDVNLYKLFLEQCLNLLRPQGECGLVIPSGIYTDLGAKKLREMLFGKTNITGLFCFENRKAIFEGVDSRFKFVVLTFEKDGITQDFPARFMRHDVQELQHFPDDETLSISVDLVNKLSPDSLSVMEFKNEIDFQIAEKMVKFPLLGEKLEGKWNLELHREFNITDDAFLFHQEQKQKALPVYEGKIIHQFTHQYNIPRYWVDEQEGRQAILKKQKDNCQILGYQKYRLAYRLIASNTNERSLICTIIPPGFIGNYLNFSKSIEGNNQLICVSILNSFVVDWLLRQKVTTNINMFYIYQLTVPRLIEGEPYFDEIVERAAKLICTTPEFDDLAAEVGLGSHKNGVTDESDRAKLRAELDGMIAHLYGLTETEFQHILSTFPIVPEPVKIAALNAYRDVTKGLIKI
ncbi:MAG: DNA methyltransferase [Xenococcaceae cyanobacterium]